jgi:uncharacterized protein (TIGR02217 family)
LSNLLFPTIPSQGWSVFKAPNFKTEVQTSASGKEVRAGLWVDPTWDFKLTWEILKDGNGPPSDIRTFINWFIARQGAFDSFLFTDPTDNTVAAQLIGIGDGTTKSFQLSRSFIAGGGLEAIQNPNAVTAAYLNGVVQAAFSYSAGAENLLRFSQAFTNALWTLANSGASNPTVTDNAIVAPDGTTTAATIAYPSTVGASVYSDIRQATLLAYPGQQFTFSVWLKVASGAPTIQLFVNDSIGLGLISSTPTLSATWTRYSVTGTFPGVVLGPPGVIIRATNQAAVTVHAWGAQLERWPSAPTLYTPTAATALQPNGLLTFGTAPAVGVNVTADFSYYFRLRFKNDMQEFENFINNLWNAKTVELRSIKL